MVNNNVRTEMELTDEQLDSICGAFDHDYHPEHHDDDSEDGWYDQWHRWHPGQRRGWYDRWHHWHWYND